jgi:signal transduction histidine kinase
MTLRFKTVIGVALIEAFLLALLIGTVVNYQHDTAEEALQKRARTTATLFASMTKDPVLSLDLATLDAFSHELLDNPDLVYVRVLDATGQLYSADGDADALSRPFIEDQTLDEATDGIFDTSADIVEADIIYGRVEIGFSTGSISDVISDTRSMSIGIAAVEMLLVALFSYLLGTYLTKQLKVLRRAAKKISDGDFTGQIDINTRDEVADVASAFNRMSSALLESQQARDKFEKELIDLNHTLEQRVERRTEKINRQVIELQQANNRIEETQAKLVQSEKLASVGQLAAGVAHEINNPIGFVRSNLSSLSEYLELYQKLIEQYRLLDELPADKRDSGVEKIRSLEEEEDLEFVNEDALSLLKDCIDGTTRVRDIVQGLRDFSNVGGEGKEPCDINECIQSTLQIVASGVPAGCEIATELEDIPDTLGHRSELSQVLVNLLMNAAHAVGEKGVVTVRSRVVDANVTIEVADNGSGIDAKIIDKLFDPFFTTKPVGEGTGLGLAISYGIIRDHAGDIAIDSELGVGTTVTITLPIAPSLSLAA